MAIRSASARYRSGVGSALVGLVVLLAVIAYVPFDWSPPRYVSNDVTRAADGTLVFGERNAARTPGPPEWLDEVRAGVTAQIELEVRPGASQRFSPASILMVAEDYWHTNVAIGQDGSDLLIWLRRVGSDANGDPLFSVPGVFSAGEWSTIGLTLSDDVLTVVVDGRVELTEDLPPGSTRTWGSGRIALGDEVHGGRSWQGAIRRAEVRTPEQSVDYVEAGALDVPERFFYVPDHVEPFRLVSGQDWLSLGVHVLSFVAVGFLLVAVRRPPIPSLTAVLLATGLSLLLAGGKFLFEARHTSVADLLAHLAGAVAGVLAARWLLRRERAFS